MSQIIQKRLEGYEPLPEWTDDPTDSSLRESDVCPPNSVRQSLLIKTIAGGNVHVECCSKRTLCSDTCGHRHPSADSSACISLRRFPFKIRTVTYHLTSGINPSFHRGLSGQI